MSIELSPQQGAAKVAFDDAELVRQARTCIYGTKQTDALLAKMADRIEALIAERDAARDAALEEAAKVAESPDLLVFKRGWSTSQDAAAISTMMAVAAAIRALKGKSQ